MKPKPEAHRIPPLDHGNDWVQHAKIGVGADLYICWNLQYPVPLGFVWGLAKTKRCFEVLGSYVPAFARRRGVRTAIQRAIQKSYPTVITSSATEDGRAFMRSSGYRFDRGTEHWFAKKGWPVRPMSERR